MCSLPRRHTSPRDRDGVATVDDAEERDERVDAPPTNTRLSTSMVTIA